MLRTRQVFEPLLRVAEVGADTVAVAYPVAVDAVAVVVVVAAAEIAVEESFDAETLSVAAAMKKSVELIIVD